MLMHHANRVRWQHKNITPRFHSAYTSLHYRFQSRPRHDQPTVIGINPGQKSDAGPSTIHSKSLFDRVWIDEEGTIHLFIFSFLYFYFLFRKFLHARYTLYSRPVIEFTNPVLSLRACRYCTPSTTCNKPAEQRKKKKKKKGIWIKKATGRENLVHDGARIFVHAI